MTSALLEGLLAGLGVAVPVGAVGVYLVALSARTSLRTGVAAALGVATADGLYATAAVTGGAAVATALEAVAGPVRLVSAAVLLLVAARLLRAALRPAAALALPTGRGAYLRLLLLTLVNPLTVVLFTALVLGTRTADGAVEGAAFVAGVVVASWGWQVLLAAGGAGLGRAVTGHRGRVVTGVASALLLAGLALRVVLAG